MRGVVCDVANAAALATDHLLHALLNGHAAVALLARIHDRDGIGGLVVGAVEGVEIRRRLGLLLDLGLGLDRLRARVAIREEPIVGRTTS